MKLHGNTQIVKMDKLAAEPQKGDCCICFSNENNTTLTNLHSEKMWKYCGTYLDNLIIINSLENETPMSCCTYCYESAQQLALLANQIEKLNKKISDLSLLFSKNVLERRSRFKNEKEESADRSTLQTDKGFISPKNPDRHFNVVVEKVSVKQELLPESQVEIETDNSVTDLWLNSDQDVNLCENYIQSAGADIDVKHSFDDQFSKALNSCTKQREENQRISGTNAQDFRKSVKISQTDLLKCLKMPIIRLQRIQPCRTKISPKIVAGEELINYEKDNKEDSDYEPNKDGGSAKNLRHTGGRTFKCSFCTKPFRTLFNLKRHEQIHIEGAQHKCSDCEKSFRTERLLKIHITLHTKSLLCSICLKSFSKLEYLKQHQAIHYAERPFKCTFCTKSFLRQPVLEIHERVHTGERPFPCSLCSKSFRSSYQLNAHKRNHSEKKNYNCNFCSGQFKTAFNLKRHEKIKHVGERQDKYSNCEETSETIKWEEGNQLSHHEHEHGDFNHEEFILP